VDTDVQNGTALLNALSSITDVSATKRYLLYIEPGTYDLDGNSLAMEQYVDIQGAGELSTLITSSSSTSCQEGTVKGASNAELRFLTVRNIGSGECTAAISNTNASPCLTHVTATAAGGNDPSDDDWAGFVNRKRLRMVRTYENSSSTHLG
jgi:hypothetical protein